MLAMSAQLIAVSFVYIKLHTQLSPPKFNFLELATSVLLSIKKYGSDMLLRTVGGTQSKAAFITCHSEIIIVARK